MLRLLLACALAAPLPALAFPTTWPHQGRLLDVGGPLDGDFSVRFALYRDASGGTPLWTETRTVSFDAGYYSVLLGEVTPLPPSLTDDDALWLGIRVGTASELPRVRLAAIPYARRAAVADNVTGDITPSSISIGGSVVIDDTGAWVGSPAGLQGPPGQDADPNDVAAALSADTGFVSDVAADLATNYADDLRGPAGPPGNDGSPDTGSDILTKLAQVDGDGSGLDADSVDGWSAQELLDQAAQDNPVGAYTFSELEQLFAGGIDGVTTHTALLVRATASGGPRSIRVAGQEAIDFTNDDGLAMVVVERATYDLPTTVNNVTVRRNFAVNDPVQGPNQWAAFLDALSNLDFATHVVLLASRGPIDRHLDTPINNGPTPREVLRDLGADLDAYPLDETDAFALITYPDAGPGNGLTIVSDTSTGTTGDLATLLLDEHLLGVETDATDAVFRPRGAAFRVNLYPTTWAATPDTYTGNVSYSGRPGNFTGRPATTAICQDLMGPGARLCSHADVARLIEVGAVNAFNETDPDRLTFPTVAQGGYWVSSDGGHDLYPSSTTSHNYGDCHHFTSATRSRRGSLIDPPDTSFPYGRTVTSACNNSYPLLCCR